MTCESCFYWYHDNHFGSCKRFPKIEVKNKNDWCGEHKPKLIIEEFIPATTADEVSEVIIKKRGRPAKEQK
jgi:hypothetical protein